MTDGSIIGWGDDLYGQMNTPAGNAFRGIAAGFRHCLALGFPATTANDCNGNRMPDSCDPDSDGDNVTNACDLCPGTIPGMSVDRCPPARRT